MNFDTNKIGRKLYLESLDWNEVGTYLYNDFDESELEMVKDKLDWFWVSKHQNLTEHFIEKHKDEVEWNCISKYQSLSKSFIEKYKDKVNWVYISRYQKLS